MRWLTAGLLAALVLSLGLTWYLQRPRWEVFYKANDPSEVTGLTERLTELKVQYRLTGDGMTIMVPASERSTANLAKAQAGLPSGGHVGLEIFAEPKFGATEFDKKVNYERAMEGELARALMRLGDIQYATVNLSLPEQSVFVRDRQQPSASVLVQLRNGRSLSKENVLAIMNFVASSVDGLTPEKVTVINDKGVLLSKGVAEMGEATGLDAEQMAQQRQREQQLTDKVLSVLEPIFGVGNVAATVNVEFEHQTTRIEERILGQAVPKATVTERSGSQAEGTTGNNAAAAPTPNPAAGAVGAPPVYQQQANQTNSNNFSSKTQTQFEVGEKNQVTVSPAGAVKRITTAVTINREELTQAQVDQIRQLAANATGATVADVTVLPMSFTPAPGTTTRPPATAESGSPLDPKTLAIALGIASFFLILAFFLTRRRKPEPEFALPGIPSQPVAAGSTLDVALGLNQPLAVQEQAASAAQAAASGPEPAATSAAAGQTDEAATAAQRLEQALRQKKSKRPPLDMEDLMDDDILADIDVLIEQAPEACAEVIRQWLKGGL